MLQELAEPASAVPEWTRLAEVCFYSVLKTVVHFLCVRVSPPTLLHELESVSPRRSNLSRFQRRLALDTLYKAPVTSPSSLRNLCIIVLGINFPASSAGVRLISSPCGEANCPVPVAFGGLLKHLFDYSSLRHR